MRSSHCSVLFKQDRYFLAGLADGCDWLAGVREPAGHHFSVFESIISNIFFDGGEAAGASGHS